LTDADRRRLAVLGKQLGRKALAEVATIATPETILRWYRELVAKKYDGSQRRGPAVTIYLPPSITIWSELPRASCCRSAAERASALV
jgi:hypothetical protein